MTNRETKEVAEMIEAAKELARADEREELSNATDQPQGVEVWVSWSTFQYARLHTIEPKEFRFDGGVAFLDVANTVLPTPFIRLLGLKEGECKKFRIVEVEG